MYAFHYCVAKTYFEDLKVLIVLYVLKVIKNPFNTTTHIPKNVLIKFTVPNLILYFFNIILASKEE